MEGSRPVVRVYTDGSCSVGSGFGGWGALLLFKKKEKKISGCLKNTTNNQMELTATIEALKVLKQPCKLYIYTDSVYVQKGITVWIHSWKKNHWRRKDNTSIKNIGLWKKLEQEIKQHEIIWTWVKGHSNNVGNNIADTLAVEARKTLKKI